MADLDKLFKEASAGKIPGGTGPVTKLERERAGIARTVGGLARVPATLIHGALNLPHDVLSKSKDALYKRNALVGIAPAMAASFKSTLQTIRHPTRFVDQARETSYTEAIVEHGGNVLGALAGSAKAAEILATRSARAAEAAGDLTRAERLTVAAGRAARLTHPIREAVSILPRKMTYPAIAAQADIVGGVRAAEAATARLRALQPHLGEGAAATAVEDAIKAAKRGEATALPVDDTLMSAIHRAGFGDSVTPQQRALAATGRFLQARDSRTAVLGELSRIRAGQFEAAHRLPHVQSLRAAQAELLRVARSLGDAEVTPELASVMVGDEATAFMERVDPSVAPLRARYARAFGAEGKALQQAPRIPAKLRTPALTKLIADAESQYRDYSRTVKEPLMRVVNEEATRQILSMPDTPRGSMRQVDQLFRERQRLMYELGRKEQRRARGAAEVEALRGKRGALALRQSGVVPDTLQPDGRYVPGTIELVHYSKEPRELIEVNRRGQGVASMSQRERESFGASYYIDSAKTEANIVGQTAYKHRVAVPVDSIVDVGKNPHLVADAAARKVSLEQHVRDSGWSGYRNSASRMPDVVTLVEDWRPYRVTRHWPVLVGPRGERILQAAVDRTLAQDGMTLNPHGGRFIGTGPGDERKIGYMAGSVNGTALKVPVAEFNTGTLRQLLSEYEVELSERGAHIGTWVQDGFVHVDPSRHFTDIREAQIYAASRGQEAIYDLASHDAIPTPAPPTAEGAGRRDFESSLRGSVGRTRITNRDVDAWMRVMDAFAAAGAEHRPDLFSTPDDVFRFGAYEPTDAVAPPDVALRQIVGNRFDHEQFKADAVRFESEKNWYIDAERYIKERFQHGSTALGDGSTIGDDQLVTNILAATSPRAAVKVNTEFARKVIDAWNASAGQPLASRIEAATKGNLPVVRGMLSDILSGNTIEKWAGEIDDQRQKVKNFHHNLTHASTDATSVTVDTWMGILWGFFDEEKFAAGKLDKKTGVLRRDTGQFVKLNPERIEQIKSDVRDIARDLGWMPNQVQAALWSAAKEHGVHMLDRLAEEGKLSDLTPGMLSKLKSRYLDASSFVDALTNMRSAKKGDLAPFERWAKTLPPAGEFGGPLNQLQQYAKGWVQFGPTGIDAHALIQLTAKADLTTLVHENAHVLRRILTPEHLDAIEGHFGVADGQWSVGHEEAFARTVERYFADGIAPSGALRGPFEAIRATLRDVYSRLKGYFTGEEIVHADVRRVLDQWFGGEVERPIVQLPPGADLLDINTVAAQPLLEQAARDANVSPQAMRKGLGAYRKGALDQKIRDLTADLQRQDADIARTARRVEAVTAAAFKKAEPKIGRRAHQGPTVPAAWQPMKAGMDALKRDVETTALKLAGGDKKRAADLVARMEGTLGGIPTSLRDVIRYAKQLGLEADMRNGLKPGTTPWRPEHVRDFTGAQVNRFAFGHLAIGEAPFVPAGKQITPGTFKERNLALRRMGRDEKSIEAFQASHAELVHAARSNELSRWVVDNVARPIPPAGPPPGWVVFDPIKHFPAPDHLKGTGATLTPHGAEFMIPGQVDTTLRRMSFRAPSEGAFLKGYDRAMNSWRAVLLTASPRWYVNNVIGNAVLATVEGVGLRDWTKAWASAKTNFADVDARVLAGSISIEVEAAGKASAFLKRMGDKFNGRVDAFARSAVYFKELRKTGDVEAAVNRGLKALVDYGDMSPLERTVARRIIPFYSWQKGILKLAARLPMDHPLRFFAMETVSRELGGYSEEERAAYPEYLYATIPVGDRLYSSRGVNPFQDFLGLVTPDGILGSLSPLVEAGGRFIFRKPSDPTGAPLEVNPSGVAEPAPRLASGVTSVFRELPQVRAAGELLPQDLRAKLSPVLLGTPNPKARKKSAAEVGLSQLGVTSRTQEDVERAVRRTSKQRRITRASQRTQARKRNAGSLADLYKEASGSK